jgi:hypothetical protein
MVYGAPRTAARVAELPHQGQQPRHRGRHGQLARWMNDLGSCKANIT